LLLKADDAQNYRRAPGLWREDRLLGTDNDFAPGTSLTIALKTMIKAASNSFPLKENINAVT